MNIIRIFATLVCFIICEFTSWSSGLKNLEFQNNVRNNKLSHLNQLITFEYYFCNFLRKKIFSLVFVLSYSLILTASSASMHSLFFRTDSMEKLSDFESDLEAVNAGPYKNQIPQSMLRTQSSLDNIKLRLASWHRQTKR